jgi:S1-C subfamily serine protease
MKTVLQSMIASVVTATLIVLWSLPDTDPPVYNSTTVVKTVVQPSVPQVVFDRLQAATVRVEVGGGCGTGVLFTRRLGLEFRTYVWTAGHVVRGVMRPDGSFEDVIVCRERRLDGLLVDSLKTAAKVICYSDPDKGEDLALLEIIEPNWSTESAEFDDCDVLPIGTPLIHVGCTLGLFNSTSLGIISQTDRYLDGLPKAFDQTSCIGYPGSSGGGVYDYDGRLVGLLVRGAGPGLNMIVPMRRIVAWAEKMGVMWAIDHTTPVPSAVVRLPVPLSDTPLGGSK